MKRLRRQGSGSQSAISYEAANRGADDVLDGEAAHIGYGCEPCLTPSRQTVMVRPTPATKLNDASQSERDRDHFHVVPEQPHDRSTDHLALVNGNAALDVDRRS